MPEAIGLGASPRQSPPIVYGEGFPGVGGDVVEVVSRDPALHRLNFGGPLLARPPSGIGRLAGCIAALPESHASAPPFSMGKRKADSALEVVDLAVDDLSGGFCASTCACAVVDLTGGDESRVAVVENLCASAFCRGLLHGATES